MLKKEDLKNISFNYDAAVVLDVLRATTTITTALKNGCRGIIPAAGVEEAKELALKDPGLLLCGERAAVKLPGFHLGNSPLEYKAETVKNKKAALTTTNGTKTIKMAAEKAGTVLIGCLLNARAAAGRLKDFSGDILLACAGTKNSFSLEDTLAAGMIIKEFLLLNSINNYSGRTLAAARSKNTSIYENEIPLNNNLDNQVILDDAAAAAYRLALYYNSRTLDALYDSLHGQKLAQMGMHDDLIYCSKVNSCSIVPVYKNGIITT